NPKKDFCDYYQVTGGKLENNESYEDCARREAKEEAGVGVESMPYVTLDKYIDKNTSNLFECAIYIGYIGKQIPTNKEPENHDDWELVDLKKFKTYKLTSSLDKYYEDIKKSILHHRINKKRKLEEFVRLDDEINNVLEIEQSNIKIETL
ncbi:3687_t:CDS:1, partial [Paraglomus brasilianum]